MRGHIFHLKTPYKFSLKVTNSNDEVSPSPIKAYKSSNFFKENIFSAKHRRMFCISLGSQAVKMSYSLLRTLFLFFL